MSSKYFNEYHAHVKNDHLEVQFYRLYRDGRDIMCDSLQPQWEPEDDYDIELKKLLKTSTTELKDDGYGHVVRCEYEKVETLKTLRIKTDSKQVANYIWALAKRGARFDDIKALHEAKIF